jgi:hypothetical protein
MNTVAAVATHMMSRGQADQAVPLVYGGTSGGDGTSPLLWVVILCVGAIVLAVLAAVLRMMLERPVMWVMPGPSSDNASGIGLFLFVSLVLGIALVMLLRGWTT